MPNALLGLSLLIALASGCAPPEDEPAAPRENPSASMVKRLADLIAASNPERNRYANRQRVELMVERLKRKDDGGRQSVAGTHHPPQPAAAKAQSPLGSDCNGS